MADTVNNVNNELIKFRKTVSYSFLRGTRFDQFTGGIEMPIQRVKELENGGKQINIPLIDQLRTDGVGTGQLVGREEALDNYGMPLWPAWKRNAIVWDKRTGKESSINIRDVATPSTKRWTVRIKRMDHVAALLSIPTAAEQANRNGDTGNTINGLTYAAATAGNRNSWFTANTDRVCVGHAASNVVAGNLASSLANCTTTSDKMSAAMGRYLKSTAKLTTNIANWPTINPFFLEGVENEEEWYVCFMGSRAFRDLSADSEMTNTNQYARPRESGDPLKDNPLFTGAHLIKDGIIYWEIPEIDDYYIYGTGGTASPNGPLAAAGSSCDVSPVLMCGQSAYAFVVGQLPQPKRRDETDYQFRMGIGIEMEYGVGKIAKAPKDQAGTIGNLKDWGVATGFVATVA